MINRSYNSWFFFISATSHNITNIKAKWTLFSTVLDFHEIVKLSRSYLEMDKAIPMQIFK